MGDLPLSMVRKPKHVRVWTERINAEMFAACACLFMAWRGGVFGLGVFVMIENASEHRWNWREIARARLAKEIGEKHGGALPYIRNALEEDYHDL